MTAIQELSFSLQAFPKPSNPETKANVEEPVVKIFDRGSKVQTQETEDKPTEHITPPKVATTELNHKSIKHLL